MLVDIFIQNFSHGVNFLLWCKIFILNEHFNSKLSTSCKNLVERSKKIKKMNTSAAGSRPTCRYLKILKSNKIQNRGIYDDGKLSEDATILNFHKPMFN